MPLRLEELDTDQILPLRTKVLRPHLPDGQLARWDGDGLSTTHHFGLTDGEDIVAIVTYLAESPPWAPHTPAVRLRGMAVEEMRRESGLGMRLLESSLARLPLLYHDEEIVWCNARLNVAGFYEKASFRRRGEVFELPDIGPHIRMWRALPIALS